MTEKLFLNILAIAMCFLLPACFLYLGAFGESVEDNVRRLYGYDPEKIEQELKLKAKSRVQ